MRLLDIVVPLAIVLFVLPGPGSAFTSNRLSNIIQARVGEADPLVKLGQGTFRGIRQRIDGVDLELFLGVPFAKPPTGSRRFAAPEPLDDIAVEKHDTLNASAYGPACIQPNSVIAMSEDCLTINIIRAAGTAPGDNLPVLQWIYGGAFTNGSTAPYNGTRLVAASARAGRPIIYVSANYVSIFTANALCMVLPLLTPSSLPLFSASGRGASWPALNLLQQAAKIRAGRRSMLDCTTKEQHFDGQTKTLRASVATPTR